MLICLTFQPCAFFPLSFLLGPSLPAFQQWTHAEKKLIEGLEMRLRFPAIQ